MQEPTTHSCPKWHLPQVPPHPSGPHSLPAQFGMHSQVPFTHPSPAAQVPQDPPHPSDPHSFPVQSGVQVPLPQPPQSFTHSFTQKSSQALQQQYESMLQTHASHLQPSQPGLQEVSHPGPPKHFPLALHSWSGAHSPQNPPHPSGPHSLPAQAGVQAGVSNADGPESAPVFPAASVASIVKT